MIAILVPDYSNPILFVKIVRDQKPGFRKSYRASDFSRMIDDCYIVAFCYGLAFWQQIQSTRLHYALGWHKLIVDIFQNYEQRILDQS